MLKTLNSSINPAQLLKIIEGQARLLNEAKQVIAAKNKDLEAKDKDLEAKDKDLAAQNADIIKHSKVITAQRETINNQGKVIVSKEALIVILEERLKLANIQKFAAKSEKNRYDLNGSLFNESELEQMLADLDIKIDDLEPETEQVTYTRRKPSRKQFPAHLPREVIEHDLEEHEKFCNSDICNNIQLKRIDTEESEQLEYIPAQIKVIVHQRHKYVCPCCESFTTAQKPAQIIPKSYATPSLLATVATQKYVDALPLYRQSKIFKRHGVDLPDNTLGQWMIKVGQAVAPLIQLITKHIREQSVIGVDETTLQVLKEPGKAANSKSYMWVATTLATEDKAVLFKYSADRTHNNILDIVGDTYTGALMSDGFSGYETAQKKCGFTHLGCLVHVRRKFKDARAAYGKKKPHRVDPVLTLISSIYRLDAQCKKLPQEKQYDFRQSKIQPLYNKIKKWLDEHKNTAPSTLTGQAILYARNQWHKVERSLLCSTYPLDNNMSENAVRPFVIGRKNYLFSGTPHGASASANLYTLIETAKANEIEPFAYLQHVFEQLPIIQEKGGDIGSLLPWNCQL